MRILEVGSRNVVRCADSSLMLQTRRGFRAPVMGFTLLELLVVITIMAMATAACAAPFEVIVRTRCQPDAATEGIEFLVGVERVGFGQSVRGPCDEEGDGAQQGGQRTGANKKSGAMLHALHAVARRRCAVNGPSRKIGSGPIEVSYSTP